MKKKIYLVVWKDSWLIVHSDIVKAKDIAQAWKKVKFRHPFSVDRVVSIEEMNAGRK